MTTNTNKPALTLRDRGVRVTVWANETENGTRHSAQLSRSFRDDSGYWKETSSLSNGELLQAANLLTQAYNRIQELKAELKSSDDTEAGE